MEVAQLPAICGMAVETMVASIAIMNIEAMTEAKTSGRRNLGGLGIGGS
ncbi:hypothetical protein [Muricoccus vinaceus]|uniref:Uncharacterized protein n=1 Tax=Muricoccus vinaceus TaxID=424704 RepID=A0ABV6IUT1_9PROT